MKTCAPALNLSMVTPVPGLGSRLGPLSVQPRKIPKCLLLKHPRITADPDTLHHLPHAYYLTRSAWLSGQSTDA